MYDKHFPWKKPKLKTKALRSSCITARIKRSSKWKKQLYKKFLKKGNQKNETEYKNYKRLFESIKRRSKKLHFIEEIIRFSDKKSQGILLTKLTTTLKKINILQVSLSTFLRPLTLLIIKF